jgi:exocyst complex component 1
MILTQESLEKASGIQRLEEALTELYRALQAGRDNGMSVNYDYRQQRLHNADMAATMERLDEYRTHNAQFCKRLLDFLSIMFTAQVRSFALW